MGEAGIFIEDARVELVAGEIFELSPIGDRHVGGVNYLTEYLAIRLVGTDFMISVQNPIHLSVDGEPQFDLAVVRRSVRGVAAAADVLLATEPHGDRYRQLLTVGRGETPISAVLPAIAVPVDDILG